MRRIIEVLVLASIFVTHLSSQFPIQKPAEKVRQFETHWLTAELNNNQSWLDRFSAQKLNVLPEGSGVVRDRHEAVKALTETTLPPNSMKVRISGTISLLTNDPAQNRSYYFLDTFNKTDGKWRVIASNISPITIGETTVAEQAERDLRTLENELARAETTSNRSALVDLLSPDLISTSTDGKVRNRDELIARPYARVKSVVKSDLEVRVLHDSLAVVTGVDETVRLDEDGKEIVYADRFTNTWSKNRNGQWLCVASQATRLR